MFESKIDVQQAVAGLRKREKGLITYEKIMTSYKNTNLSNDMTFQRTFNGFYRIRRNEDWRKFYYENFEKWKNESTPTFPLILETLYRHTGRVECSFSSKMLATLVSRFSYLGQHCFGSPAIASAWYKLRNKIPKRPSFIRKYSPMVSGIFAYPNSKIIHRCF